MSGVSAPSRVFTLRPSDFNFLWEECRRCYWLQVVRDWRRPRMPFPRVFGVLADLEATSFDGQRTEDMLPGVLPPGTFRHGEQDVLSAPITLAGSEVAIALKGRLDMMVAFDDGGWGVIDFKTSLPHEVSPVRYGRQLHAYAWCLERPAPGAFGKGPIGTMGLLCLEPREMRRGRQTAEVYGRFHPEWVDVPRDDAAFEGFLAEVAGVLAADAPPPPGPRCGYCDYRARTRAMEW